jgi:hypothetical protein
MGLSAPDGRGSYCWGVEEECGVLGLVVVGRVHNERRGSAGDLNETLPNDQFPVGHPYQDGRKMTCGACCQEEVGYCCRLAGYRIVGMVGHGNCRSAGHLNESFVNAVQSFKDNTYQKGSAKMGFVFGKRPAYL